MGVAS